MAKLAPTSIKYVIKAKIKAKGIIDKPDVIGAVFGQTEGLLGTDLDLRELQQTGKIGRIEVNIISKDGNSDGDIIIPSAMDAAETSLLAATLETIERVGPCQAKITLEGVEDTRSEKRKYVVDKAKEILKGLMASGEEVSEVSEHIKESVRTHEITQFNGLPAGPDIEDSEEILIVEGRADIVNLLKFGIRNTIAVEGTSIPDQIVELSKQKTTTLFVDGDRGGQLIARELFQKTDVDFVAVAPEGKEVEDLTRKEAFKAIRDRVTAEQFKAMLAGGKRPRTQSAPKEQREERTESTEFAADPLEQVERFPRRERFARGGGRFRGERAPMGERSERAERYQKASLGDTEKSLFKQTLEELVGSRAACIFSQDNTLLGKVPVSELQNALKTLEHPYTVIFDGKVDFTLHSLAKKKGIRYLVGMEKEEFHTSSLVVVSRADLE